MLPVMLDVTDHLAVVVGGGPVGRRKAEAFLKAGGHVRLVCLEPPPADLPDALQWLTEPYRRDHLTDAVLVFAAAPAEVNSAVVADAKALGLWVCSGSEPSAGNFALPATSRRGRLTLAVSTGGAAPALARRIARQLGDQFDAVFADWLDLLAEFRPLVLAKVSDAEKRRRLFEGWGDPAWIDRLRREGRDAVRDALVAEVEALAHPSGRPV